MGRFSGYGPCPRCRDRGADSRGDNLATYADGSVHCFACGYHRNPNRVVQVVREVESGKTKSALPLDFCRDVPASGWKWLLQYGLPYSYWKPYVGYSPADERLILTVGDPIRFSIGRYIGTQLRDGPVRMPEQARQVLSVLPTSSHRKWRLYGDRHGYVEVLGASRSGAIEGLNYVGVVEDLISGHKLGQVIPTIPLFGTDLHTKAIQALRAFKRPVALWLDEDQYGVLAKKINRLQAFLDVPVKFIRKRKDPKEYSIEESKEILYGL